MPLSFHSITHRAAAFFPGLSERRFEESVRQELPTLYRVARRMVGSSDDAEDLVGQTLHRAFTNRKTFDGTHLRSWLIAILRNELLNELRYRRRHPVEELEDAHEPADEGSWAEIANRIDSKAIMDALDEVPPLYQEVIQLFDIEEMTYEEIAESLDIPIGTVRSRLSRGRAILRRKLSGKVEGLAL